jgi:8-oxo-dGTP pyrophosphatase MutT (NUDIX family)
MENLAKTEIIAGVVIKKESKYLLVQEKKSEAYGLWNFPAGHVKKHETIEQTAIRETREETGYEVEIIRKIDILQKTPQETVKHVFEARIIGGKLKYPKEEILNIGWFNFEDIMKMKDKLRAVWILEVLNILEKNV